MSLHELNKIVGRAAKALYDNEKFPVEVLAVRARKAAENFPSDPTVVAMSNFLTKRASSDIFITRSELKDVYRRVFSQNTKFGGFFAEELGIGDAPKTNVMKRHPKEGTNFMAEAYERHGDPVLANALTSVFDPKAAYKPYSPSIAKMAERTCLHELNRMVAPRKIDVVAGQSDLLLCQATFETPRGHSNVLVPVEIKEGHALIPTVFLSSVGFVDLTKSALENHILETAGQVFRVDAQQVLQVIATAKNGAPEPLSEMEIIIARTRSAKGSNDSANNIINQQVDPAQIEVETPRLAEADSFERKLASSQGIAEFTFGRQTIDVGRKMLKQDLTSLGYKHAHVTVADADETTVYFAVSVDGQAGFKVPMKVVDRVIQNPKIVISSGNLYQFSKEGISQVLASEAVDTQAIAVASPAYGLRAGELVEQVRVAIGQGNTDRAEDALVVLQASNQAAFKEALAIYQQGLNGQIKTASENSCCKTQRKVAYSKYMICGHTNLPVHKVYQDKNGDCQPLYRRSIAEAEGGSFMHSKVYFG